MIRRRRSSSALRGRQSELPLPKGLLSWGMLSHGGCSCICEGDLLLMSSSLVFMAPVSFVGRCRDTYFVNVVMKEFLVIYGEMGSWKGFRYFFHPHKGQLMYAECRVLSFVFTN